MFPLFVPIVLDVCRTLITILDSLHTHRPDIQQVNKQQLKLDMEQQTGSKLGKEYVKAVYCHPAYLFMYAGYIMRYAGLDETQAGIKIAGRNINNLSTIIVHLEKETHSTLKKKKTSEIPLYLFTRSEW